MTDWFTTAIVGPGRLPLFFMMLAFATAFAFIRISTRMIRADVSWWPGNVTPGGLHIHHVVFGLVMMLVSGFGFIALANYHTPATNCVLAAVFGVGAALVLDEFALSCTFGMCTGPRKVARVSMQSSSRSPLPSCSFWVCIHSGSAAPTSTQTMRQRRSRASCSSSFSTASRRSCCSKERFGPACSGCSFLLFSSSAPSAWDAPAPLGHGGDTVLGQRRCAARIAERTHCAVLPIARKYESRKLWPVDSTAIRHHDQRCRYSRPRRCGTFPVQLRPRHEKG